MQGLDEILAEAVPEDGGFLPLVAGLRGRFLPCKELVGLCIFRPVRGKYPAAVAVVQRRHQQAFPVTYCNQAVLGIVSVAPSLFAVFQFPDAVSVLVIEVLGKLCAAFRSRSASAYFWSTNYNRNNRQTTTSILFKLRTPVISSAPSNISPKLILYIFKYYIFFWKNAILINLQSSYLHISTF